MPIPPWHLLCLTHTHTRAFMHGLTLTDARNRACHIHTHIRRHSYTLSLSQSPTHTYTHTPIYTGKHTLKLNTNSFALSGDVGTELNNSAIPLIYPSYYLQKITGESHMSMEIMDYSPPLYFPR